MPHWLIKSAIHRCISLLPCSKWWNQLLQTRVSKSMYLGPERFEQRLEFCHRHLEDFISLCPRQAENFTVFELGTGWYPVVPACLYLCGASRIWTVDIASHLRTERVEHVLQKISEYAERGKLQQFLPRTRSERLATLRQVLKGAAKKEPSAILEEMNIRFMVRDAQNTGLDADTIDFFVSDGVLQHIPRLVLANMLAEFKRIARPGAVLSHHIRLGDLFAPFDRSISVFNFLKYSDARWKWLDSPLIPSNRLRISDYRQLFAQAGCQIVREENQNGATSDLERIRPAPKFQSYSQADLLVIRSWLLAQFRTPTPRPAV
jgi:SAM-dependent methyltransferase